MDENEIPFSEKEMERIYKEFLEERKYYENHPEEAIKYSDEKAEKDNESLTKFLIDRDKDLHSKESLYVSHFYIGKTDTLIIAEKENFKADFSIELQKICS